MDENTLAMHIGQLVVNLWKLSDLNADLKAKLDQATKEKANEAQ